MSIVEKLTEGIINRDLSRESDALLSKWEKTGLLEGIDGDSGRQGMACLLENQAKELLREASTMEAGSVEGFAAVAFPIVRRVFGGLVANDLVSVQPMSLPSGLIFFLDFKYNSTRLGSDANDSVYGGGVVGQQITGGVNLSTMDNQEDSYYNLNNGYSSPTGSSTSVTMTVFASGTFSGTGSVLPAGEVSAGTDAQRAFNALLRFDPDFTSGTTTACIFKVAASQFDQLNKDDLVAITRAGSGSAAELTGSQVRRLTQYSGSNRGMWQAGDAKSQILFVMASLDGSKAPSALASAKAIGAGVSNWKCTWPEFDDFGGTPTAGSANALGAIVGQSEWGLENEVGIPEIDIKVDSVSITAMTKKLKAKWTPELQQDINAYHNLDAEVELTSILSETIALEIDQEILEDLIKGSAAGTQYWSRKPGKFVNKSTGKSTNQTLFPDFTGTVSEWYETLLETVNDVSAQIHRKTLRGGANFLVCGPETANVLEFTNGFRASTTADEDRGQAGAVKTGTISKKWDIYVDPYFMRNVILVGRKGGSFLESGYVYAPYVPLQTTPTIFDPESFVPRKGVMTRYGKKMVRPDMYGLVIIEDMIG
jgi:hypothetical protein